MNKRRPSSDLRRVYLLSLTSFILSLCFSLTAVLAAIDQQQLEDTATGIINNATNNGSTATTREMSFAGMIDRALEKEFTENDQNEENDAGSFNNSVAGEQAVLETVARVKSKKNDTKEDKSSTFLTH